VNGICWMIWIIMVHFMCQRKGANLYLLMKIVKTAIRIGHHAVAQIQFLPAAKNRPLRWSCNQPKVETQVSFATIKLELTPKAFEGHQIFAKFSGPIGVICS
jgi:hypothetical protein